MVCYTDVIAGKYNFCIALINLDEIEKLLTEIASLFGVVLDTTVSVLSLNVALQHEIMVSS